MTVAGGSGPCLVAFSAGTPCAIGTIAPGADVTTRIDLLGNDDEYLQAWAIRLLCEDHDPPEPALREFERLASEGNSSLVRLQKTLSELLVQQQTSNQKFQEEVKEALAAMKARKEESLRSTRHGVGFEDTLFEILHREAQRHGDIAVQTGNTTGLIKGRKVGDAVVELSQESAAPGAKIVFEAKEDKSYDLAAARAEIELCRQNRGRSRRAGPRHHRVAATHGR